MDKNTFVAVSLLVVSKEFDSVCHDHFESKLKDLEFCEPALTMVHSFVSNSQRETVSNNTESN